MMSHMEETYVMAPASGKSWYHSAFAGGYVDHVNRVVEYAVKQSRLYKEMGGTIDYTEEELVFAALFHDLGKIGDGVKDNYIPQTDKWRQPLEVWKQYFTRWIRQPEPKALMHASIFFDMRPVFGPMSLFNELQDDVLASTKDNDIFLAGMAGNSLTESPPLGFFRKFVLERDGSEVKGMDLKHKGSALINDIARVYALSAGIKEVNTAKRIRALMDANIINRKDALNLADAHEFIAHMRLANQGYQVTHNLPVNNFLKPHHLSSLLRHQLRDAFKVVHDA